MATRVTQPNDLKSFILEKAANYQDKVIDPNDLYAIRGEKSLNYLLAEKDQYPFEHLLNFSHSALSQILTKFRIPGSFYRRNPINLQLQMFNYWKSKYKTQKGSQKKLLLRINHGVEKNYIRAVMSDTYGIMDDKDLFPEIITYLEGRNDITYHALLYDDHITQVFILFHDCRGTFNGVDYSAGVCITNSETGHSSIWIEPVVYYNPSTEFVNRESLRKQGVDCRIIHKGELNKERVLEMVEKAKEISQIGIIQLAEAFSKQVPKDQMLDRIQNMEAVPSRFIEMLKEEWSRDEYLANAEAAKLLLDLAQTLPLFQKIQIEQATGKMLGLFDNYQDRFSDLVQEIQNDG